MQDVHCTVIKLKYLAKVFHHGGTINSAEWPLVGSLRAVATLFARVCADRETGFKLGSAVTCIDSVFITGLQASLGGNWSKTLMAVLS